MRVSDKLGDLYGSYYEVNSALGRKRAIAARQTMHHVKALLPDPPYNKLIDIGAGEGSFLSELSDASFAIHLHAVEISQSGVDWIVGRNISNLKSIQQFDGYSILASDKAYEVGTAVHVLEHVEHERAFLQEITRVCELVYIEVPLELTVRAGRAVKLSEPYGHINFYNPVTFRNLLNTCGIEIVAFKIFSNSLDYEVNVSGKVSGRIKFALRTSLLAMAPSAATFAMTYLAGAVCRRK